MLKLVNLWGGYGDQQVIFDLSIEVEPGEIVSLIGANGAGKTTTLRAAVGLATLTKGHVEVAAKTFAAPKPTGMLTAGVALVPEGRGILAGLTVEEHLLTGAYTIRDAAVIKDRVAEVYDMFPRLLERRRISAMLLSGGEQQMLAIGRALVVKPSYLLLDEPSMGLSPLLVSNIADLVKRLARANVGILLAEQNANMALSISDHAYLIQQGRIAMSGSGEELNRHSGVRAAYLGKEGKL
jgi:branched-chain amino acid transport system ATP-binding protein